MSSPDCRRTLPLILLAAMASMPQAALANFNVNVSSVIAEYFVQVGSTVIRTTVPLVKLGTGEFFLNQNIGGLNATFTVTPIMGSDSFAFDATGTFSNAGTTVLDSVEIDFIAFFRLQNGLVPLLTTAELDVTAQFGGVANGTSASLSVDFGVARLGVIRHSGAASAALTAGEDPFRFTASDVNGDGRVDANDSANWRATFGSATGGLPSGGAFDFPSSLDLTITLQPIPEPSVWLMLGAGLSLVSLRLAGASRKRRSLH